MGERRYYNIGMWLAITNYIGAFLICFLEYESGGSAARMMIRGRQAHEIQRLLLCRVSRDDAESPG